MTKLPEIRDRSVVKSSVMPSAKYSCSGSFDRFAKGSTTIDRRGAVVLAMAGVSCGPVAAGAGVATVGEFRFGHAHQAAAPMAITTAMLAVATASRKDSRRRGKLACAGVATSGSDATVAALIAKA